MIPATSANPTEHLQTIINRWADLQDALSARQTTTWPPVMGIVHLVHDDERAAHTAERLDTAPDAPGNRPVPLDLGIYDTMRAIEQDLVELADQTAALIQRSPMSYAPRDWPAADRARRNQLAAADARGLRRWRYTGQRSAPYAAAWLAARLHGQPGPFDRLTDGWRHRITAIAATTADRVDRALGTARRRTAVPPSTGRAPCAAGSWRSTAATANRRSCGAKAAVAPGIHPKRS
ncbi:hypothetical protein SBI_02516 [Streptomyces bingchenggensis BCW-1]|uniref:Uncharacterized protein n=1 Tax=Streptomyces bingchenggensis (strain BCW-1) TaxID=749414 RepID=D7BYS8_STRBB|nr:MULTISPECIES: hypothetical protein [Streptomyces]ADI05637.1 hypothetical protein SBI_02516 [Streptomyces bingchenggensis BCW-1]